MDTKLKGLWDKVKEFFKKMSMKVRILLGVAVIVIIAAIVAVVYMANNQPYSTLFTGLTATDISSIMAYLDENGVTDYRVEGDSILVKAEQEHVLKANLIYEGYPKSGFLYDSYFNNVSSLSTTSERDTAFLIATQERMEATIACLEGVKSAVVSISPGKNQTYVLDDSNKVDASASVTVTMKDGYSMTKKLANGIRTVVAKGVEGLDIGQVEIIDQYGNTYSDLDTMGTLSDGSALKLQLEEETNNKVRNNILQALSGIYGPDNVRVAVHSVVDVSRKVVQSTEYSQPAGSKDGAGLIGSETWLSQITEPNGEAVGGVVGSTVNSDIPEYLENELEVSGNESYVGTSGEREYDNNQSVTQMEVIAGTVTDISVSVTINENSSNSNSVDMATLKNHVAMAAGLGIDDPGDRISVVIAPFYEPSVFVGPGSSDTIELPGWALYAAIGGVVLFLLLLILIIVLVRRSKKKKKAEA